jgi:peroxiredoxin family protein
MAADLLILAHGGSWDMRFQTTSLAASAAAAGESVAVALFFAALDAWVGRRWDVLDPAPPVSAAHLASLDLPPLSSLLAPGREAGLIRVYACSASCRVLGVDLGAAQAAVDAVLGWQTFARMTAEVGRVVTL